MKTLRTLSLVLLVLVSPARAGEMERMEYEEVVPQEQHTSHNAGLEQDFPYLAWGLIASGIAGLGFYGRSAYRQWNNTEPYVYRDKKYSNSCPTVLSALTHRHVEAHPRNAIYPWDESRAIKKMANLLFRGRPTLPDEKSEYVARPLWHHIGPLALLLAGVLKLSQHDERTPEQSEFAAVLQHFYEPEFAIETNPSPEEIKRQIKENDKLLAALADIYGDERAIRLILAILQSPEWDEALTELSRVQNETEFFEILGKHKAKLDAFLKQFANKKEAKGRSEVVLDELTLRDILAAREWQTRYHQEKEQDWPGSRRLLPRHFFEREQPLPWDDFPNLKRAFSDTAMIVLAGVERRNKPLPPLYGELEKAEPQFIKTDRKMIQPAFIDRMSGLEEIKASMPEGTQNLIEAALGRNHPELAEKLLIEIGKVWHYPDLMVDYRPARDEKRILREMTASVEKMRHVIDKTSNPTVPLTRTELEDLAQWTAVHLVLFNSLEKEVPKTDVKVTKSIQRLNDTLFPSETESKKEKEAEP